MDGRAFLPVAKRLAQALSEADWRTAAGRAYYALMLEVRGALERWGFTFPRSEQVHRSVRLRFLYSGDSDLRDISMTLEELGKLRAKADCHIEKAGGFAAVDETAEAIDDAEEALALLDTVTSDGARCTAAIGAIRKAFP